MPRENIASLSNQCSVTGTYDTKNRKYTLGIHLLLKRNEVMKFCNSTVHCTLRYVTNPAFDPVSKQPELKFCAVRIETEDL